ncbi:copper resistance protein CopC [Marinobacterium sp. AK62]|uniref:Copper resistance protein CopC n=1 Tax=Marinobacterium alkalitolerans TaxID=1542925 RepID=A0ABS3ZA51_9GAMM|nr:copper resistance CopC family protein [Marinobacterium alkalitolerans]MBP0048575.1 copper resistance protein CopC [Marinobacterium alkalitolerans]
MNKLKTLIAAGLIAVSVPALAHTDMMSSQPMDGAMVMEPVKKLELNFGMDVRLVKLRLIDSSDKPVSIGFKPIVEPTRSFSVPLPTLTPDNYRVQWTAMGDDGHKMTGSFQFMQH